jgi:TonB-linked SusC/RagA family outer membrane protein
MITGQSRRPGGVVNAGSRTGSCTLLCQTLSNGEWIVAIRGRLVVLIALLSALGSRAAPAQERATAAAESAALSGAELTMGAGSDLNAPLLRSVVSLDLRDAPLREALRDLSREMGGRLMYDESVTSIPHRVTLRSEKIRSGQALRAILAGTDVAIFVSDGGQLVLLKRVPPGGRSARERSPSVLDSVTVSGYVVDSATGEPIASVLVAIDGTTRRTMTAGDGSFSLPDVPAGRQVMSTRRLGFRTVLRSIVLLPGRDTTIVVKLASVPNMLSEVVTTGAGEQRRMEVGTDIAVVDVAKEAEDNAFRDLSDLLAGRVKGLTVTPGGGSPNSPSRRRIRGINSINSSNDPIVIIDGIRASTSYTECADGNLVGCNQMPSRFDDLDVNSIESIEVLKGPSASALWGSDASNGVIVIKTKRGRAGPTSWTVQYDEGFTSAPTNFRIPVQGLGTAANGTSVGPCSLLDQSLGRCVAMDSVAGGFNRYTNPRTTSMATGRMTNVGVSTTGGTEAMQFYLSGSYKWEVGTAKMPEIDQKLVREALGMPLQEWMIRPSTKNNGSFTGRLTGRFSSKADYALTTSVYQILSRNGGDGVMGATSDLRTAADTFELSRGWDEFYVEQKNNATRFVGSLSVNWRPVSWFSGNAVLGRDYAFTDGGAFKRRGWCLPFCSTTSRDALGGIAYGEGRDLVQTVNLGGTVTIPFLGGRTVFRTAFGAQHNRIKTRDFRGTTYDLPVGRLDFNSSPVDNRNVTQTSDDRATFGMYVAPSLAFNDRIFVSAAIRRDVGSSLGTEVHPSYPKWSLSWLASEEPGLGLKERGISLRLRGAFGHAGTQPASTAKYRTLSQLPRFVEADGTFGSNYAIINGIGNSDLRPERSIEYEGGFELGVWDDRVMLDFTMFHKSTEDALVSRTLAPSIGLGSTTRQQYNVGNVVNKGIEAMLTARILDTRDVQLSMDVGFAARRNKLVSLGPGVEPFSITASNVNLETVKDNDGVVMPGYPLFGRWARPILGYSDANGDGIITPGEVKLADSLVYMGPSEPKADATVRPEVGLWNNRIRISGLFEYVHGLMQLNEYAATTRYFTSAAFDPKTSLVSQSCIVAAGSPILADYCFYETVNVLRLRNVSIGFMAPERVARLVRAKSATFYVMGANLGVWSGYNGIDPMVNTADAAGNRTVGGAIVPRGKDWTFRLRLTY